MTRDSRDDAREWLLNGCVQGKGVRPSILRLALRYNLVGFVQNTSTGVRIQAFGSGIALRQFHQELSQLFPQPTDVQTRSVDLPAPRPTDFRIIGSHDQGALSTPVPVDQAICRDCLDEIQDQRNRRQGDFFASCAVCGPRYSLLTALPFDRERTSLHSFALCQACGQEYLSPENRRFHAQTIGCPHCGPRLWCRTIDGSGTQGKAAFAQAVSALRAGQIVALKGVGGYQLLVDAGNSAAVQRLRARKRRASKPLAVMASSLAEAKQLAWLDKDERDWLASAANPIVIARRRAECGLAANVTDTRATVGLFLPSTALHALLLEATNRPLVVTSGNLEGDPIIYTTVDAESRMQGIADLWLHHDRDITHPIDDSVVRIIAGRLCVLRQGRGLAPYRFSLPTSFIDGKEPLLALGGDKKVALALFNGAQAVLGPHLGDLESTDMLQRWLLGIETLCRLYRCNPHKFVLDAHPDYVSSQWVLRQAMRVGERYSTIAPTHRCAVFHHHAHAAAAIAEHEAWERPVLAVTWDGTGFGPDGTSWGGECLVATGNQFRRVAHLLPFSLPGGDRAAREPWRVAVALVVAALGPEDASQLRWKETDPMTVQAAVRIAMRRDLCPQTSSVGRLFDGVAALVLGIAISPDEGSAAIALEDACDPQISGILPFNLDLHGIIDWRPMIRDIIQQRARGASPDVMATRFHRTLAEIVVQVAARFPELAVATSGGVFHNRVLGEFICERLASARRDWLPAGRIPPGDGGLAAGQLVIALQSSSWI